MEIKKKATQARGNLQQGIYAVKDRLFPRSYFGFNFINFISEFIQVFFGVDYYRHYADCPVFFKNV